MRSPRRIEPSGRTAAAQMAHKAAPRWRGIDSDRGTAPPPQWTSRRWVHPRKAKATLAHAHPHVKMCARVCACVRACVCMRGCVSVCVCTRALPLAPCCVAPGLWAVRACVRVCAPVYSCAGAAVRPAQRVGDNAALQCARSGQGRQHRRRTHRAPCDPEARLRGPDRTQVPPTSTTKCILWARARAFTGAARAGGSVSAPARSQTAHASVSAGVV